MINDTTDIQKRQTMLELVANWQRASDLITQGLTAVAEAEAILKDSFKETVSFRLDYVLRYHNGGADHTKPDTIIKEFKREAWKILIDRMGIRTCLSKSREAELAKQLETGEGLPEIDGPSILAMIESNANALPTYVEESIRETFRWLTPQHRAWGTNYKTNNNCTVGRKVILEYLCEHNYNGPGFRIRSQCNSELNILTNIFNRLAGAPVSRSHYGELSDAVEKSPDGTGETTYFRFKCYSKGTLHLEFKRLDLLAQFNAIAGGMNLKAASAAHPAPARANREDEPCAPLELVERRLGEAKEVAE